MTNTSSWECIFCGSREDRTREHVLRKQFNQIAKPEFVRNSVGFRSVVNGVETYRSVPGSQFDIQVKEVCGACNSGWLNDIETVVIPYLAPLLDPDLMSKPPRKVQVEDLAFWMYLRALMRTCTDGRKTSAPSRFFREAWRTRKIPSGVFIHSAFCEAYVIEAGRNTHIFGKDIDAPESEDPPYYTSLVSFGLGPLFFQVLLLDGPDEWNSDGFDAFSWIRLSLPGTFAMMHPAELPPSPQSILSEENAIIASNALRFQSIGEWESPVHVVNRYTFD